MDERAKSAFEFARDTTTQLITLATGVIAIGITFAKDFVQSVGSAGRLFAVGSWGVFLLSVVCGVWTLLALTGSLADSKAEASIGSPNVRYPAILQILAFLVALALTVAFGIAAIVGC